MWDLLKDFLKYRRFFRSLDITVILLILLLFASGFAIYAANMPGKPAFYIENVSFRLSEGKRSVELHVKVNRGSVELKQFFINNRTVEKWTTDKRIIGEGEGSTCLLEYPWKMGEYYTLKLMTTDDQFTELIAKAPVFTPTLQLKMKEVNATLSSSALKVSVNYWAYCNGTDSLHILLFTYLSFEKSNRPLYIFYDSNYMTDESMKRADAIISQFKTYNIHVEKEDYDTLEKLSKDMPKAILILVNPLKDHKGNRLGNVAPAPLVDPNGNGFLRDDSKYGKSFLYDWMRDKGLILVTVGSLQPHKRILYRGATYQRALDSYGLFDVHLFLTDAHGERSIINGSFVLGDYTPVRVSGTLGLFYREASFGFDKNSMEKYGLQYYAYGDYKLPYGSSFLNLTLPVFIRVGEGGWLAMGDEEFWLDDEQFAHDLSMIYLQTVWDSEWMPYGWYWDNGGAFYRNYGTFERNGTLETEFIPLNVAGEKLFLRVVGIAYSSDLGKNLISEQIAEYKKP